MKKLTVLLIFELIIKLSIGQNGLVKQFDHSYGGMSGEGIAKILPTNDGGFLIAGASNSDSGLEVSQRLFDTTAVFPFDPTSDVWLIKCDANGVKQWDVRRGGIRIEDPTDIIQTRDGGFAFTGITNSPVSYDITQPAFGANDFWVVKLDTLGNIIWQKRFGGDSSDIPSCILELPSGGFLIGGSSNSSQSGTITQTSRGSSDMYLLELDANGNQVWDKRYGGNEAEYIASIIPVQMGGYFLVGVSLSNISGEKTQNNYITGQSDIWIVKIDSAGNYISDKIIGSLDDEYGTNAIPNFDGGFIVGCVTNADAGGDKSDPSNGTGTSTPFDSDRWVIRLDSAGNIIWNKTIGGVSSEDDMANLFMNKDSTVMISGTSYSDYDASCIWKSENNSGPENLWIVAIDQNGNKVWDKTVLTGYAHAEAGFATQLKDGCFVFGDNGDALVGREKTDDSYNFDYWVIKFCDTTHISSALLPIAGFKMDLSSNCSTVCYSFADTSHNSPTSWSWSFNGAQPSGSGAEDPGTICYAQSGVYTVTLIVCNTAGCDTAINTISVSDPSAPTVNLFGDTILCGSDTAMLYATGGFNNYNWSINNSPLLIHDSIFAAVISGSYKVTATNQAGCSASDTIMVSSATNPSADFKIIKAFDCESSTLSFINNSTDATAYHWNFGDNITSSEINPTHSYYASADTITITLIAKNSECSDTFSIDTTLSYNIFRSDSIPNVFSPNNDAKNDCYSLTKYDQLFSCMEITIYSRWGERVFQSNAQNPCWNGKKNNSGPDAPDGVYFYMARYGNKQFHGIVELIR